jgi:hypothetical protein
MKVLDSKPRKGVSPDILYTGYMDWRITGLLFKHP